MLETQHPKKKLSFNQMDGKQSTFQVTSVLYVHYCTKVDTLFYLKCVASVYHIYTD